METKRYYLLDVQKEVIVREGEDGFYIASCPDIKGCHSQGKDIYEALENIADAIGGCLESISLRDLEKKISLSTKVSVPIFQSPYPRHYQYA